MWYFVLSIILGAGGHVLAKLATYKLRGFADMLTNVYVYAAVLMYGVSFLMWIMFLKGRSLSCVVPLNSLTYIVTAVLSYFVFGEKLNFIQYMGIAAITAGVYILER